MPGKVLRIVRLTRFTVLLREREINERNETRRDEARREGEGGREREGGEEGGLISVKRKGKSVALLLVHLEFLGRAEKGEESETYSARRV